MKKAFSIAFIAILASVAFSVQAKEVMANIVNVSPIYSDRVSQQQVCDSVQYDQPQQASAVNPGTVIGGIAGALLGSRVGGGNGRVAMAALGAVTGAMAGDRIEQRVDNRAQQVCRWVQRSEPQVSGYRVTYEYQGDTFQGVLPYDPSRGGAVSTVAVQMSLSMR